MRCTARDMAVIAVICSVGGTGDGGIDGIISLDKLGLEKPAVQATNAGKGTVVSAKSVLWCIA